VAQVASIVREVYFPAPKIYKLGVIQGSRTIRQMFRGGAQDFISIGIPPSKLGIMLGFQTTPGSGGREQLRPASKWFELTKLQALAARAVARELGLATVWSWGWATGRPPSPIRTSRPNACVYLWARDPNLLRCAAEGRRGAEHRCERRPADLSAGLALQPSTVSRSAGTSRPRSHA